MIIFQTTNRLFLGNKYFIYQYQMILRYTFHEIYSNFHIKRLKKEISNASGVQSFMFSRSYIAQMAFPVTFVTLSQTIPPIFLQTLQHKSLCWMTAVWINSSLTWASASDQLYACYCVEEGKVSLKDKPQGMAFNAAADFSSLW